MTDRPADTTGRRGGIRGALRAWRGLFPRSSLQRGQAPDPVLHAPADLWRGDAERGRRIMDGAWRLAGQTLAFDLSATGGAPRWYPEAAWRGWLEELHGFHWLRDLREAGGGGRGSARHAVGAWIAECGPGDRFAWRADILGRRLGAWLGHAGYLLNDCDAQFRQRFHRSLAQQTHRLARVAATAPEGTGRIASMKALLVAGLVLPGAERRRAQALRLLQHELDRQLLTDGGQRERNPSSHLSLLRDLVEARFALIAARQTVPGWLHQAIERAAPMLRFYRHGDGGLALFNGAVAENAELVDTVLALGQATGKPGSRAPDTGYERMQARRTLVIVDCGEPPPNDYAAQAHAGPLAFEMSVGKDRLIVNLGAFRGPDADWRAAARTTAAHSTVGVDERNAVEIAPNGNRSRAAQHVAVERHDENGSTWLDMSHDGYLASHRLVHRRRLYLGADGADLKGEDILEGPGGELFTVRFHLHPEVQAAMLGDGRGALLRLPSGRGWRFHSSGGVMSLTDSTYLGGPGSMRRSRQIVVSGGLNGDRTVVGWAFVQVASGDRRRRRRSAGEPPAEARPAAPRDRTADPG